MSHNIIRTHRQLLKKWRKVMDLIGPGDMEAHFRDAIGAVESLQISGAWIDLGSGAGFPGIPLAAYHPHIQLLMVESRQKRATFLKKIVQQSGATNIRVLCDRTENITEKFDGVISRAYKPPLNYLEDARQLLKPEGLAICLLGDQQSFMIPTGWKLQEKLRYPVLDGFRQRWILKFSSQ